jgi:hypothetical protein
LAEFPGKIMHAAYYGSSQPVLQESIWREAWFIYDMTYMVTGFEMIAVGIYALTDKSDLPVWPRWAGWVAIGGALSFVPESVMPYFKNRTPRIEWPVELLDRIPVVADLVRDLHLLHAAVPPASADRDREEADPGTGGGDARGLVAG